MGQRHGRDDSRTPICGRDLVPRRYPAGMTEEAVPADPTLPQLLASGVARSVSATPAVIDGREAVRVELLESISRDGVPDVDYVDMPTFLELALEFEDGTISVDVRAQLNGYWPEGARGFAGLAIRIQPGGAAFESVYLRPTNGRHAGAPSPRDRRAIQYFAYPGWRFELLRTTYPDVYETGADMTSTGGRPCGSRSTPTGWTPTSMTSSPSPSTPPCCPRVADGSACSSTSARSPGSATCRSATPSPDGRGLRDAQVPITGTGLCEVVVVPSPSSP